MIAAVDCGKKGAIAFGDGINTKVFKMPDQKAIYNFFKENKFDEVWIEHQQIRPGDVMRHSVYRISKTLIRNYSDIMFACEITGQTIRIVNPKEWQSIFNLPKDYSKRKSKAGQIAKKIYPGLKPTIEISDALLIYNYALKIRGYEQIRNKRFGSFGED